MKKGQGLSLNTIIIAAIVLIVLVVLWAIFTGRMGVFTAGVKSATGDPSKKCAEQSGTLRAVAEGTTGVQVCLDNRESTIVSSDTSATNQCCK